MAIEKWPGWRYNPANGEGQIFNREADVPVGWVDRLYKLDLQEKAIAPTDRVLTVKEIQAGLKDGSLSIEDVAAAEARMDPPRATVLTLIDKARAVIAAQTEGAVRARQEDLESATKDALEQEEDDIEEAHIYTRDEALAEIRAAGFEVEDDASEAEINKLLAQLEG